MPLDSTYIVAFSIGFLGSSHCAAMCGGIVGILSQQSGSKPQNINNSFAYNAGRILSYSFIGLLAGLVGQLALSPVDTNSITLVSRILTSLFMLAFGFHLLGWLNFLHRLEHAGQHIWKHISPMSRKLLPIRNQRSAFYLGLVWGWLPCGLVYSALAWSLASAQAINGALIMLCFGLGTLPMLLTMGIASEKLTRLKRSTTVRRIAGGIIILFALVNLLSPAATHHLHH